VIETCASSAVLCFVRQIREQSGSISVVVASKGVKRYAYAIISGFELSSVMSRWVPVRALMKNAIRQE
jgi:hypothetical protein